MRQHIEDELISIAKALQGGTHGWCECSGCARWQWLHRLVDRHPCIRAQYVLEQRADIFEDGVAYTWAKTDEDFLALWEKFDDKNRATLRHRFGKWLEQFACHLT